MAVRVCQGLGLHVEAPEDENLSDVDRELRRRVYWTCFVMDRMSSTTYGRPTAIREDMTSAALPSPRGDMPIIAEADQSPGQPDLIHFFVRARLLSLRASFNETNTDRHDQALPHHVVNPRRSLRSDRQSCLRAYPASANPRTRRSGEDLGGRTAQLLAVRHACREDCLAFDLSPAKRFEAEVHSVFPAALMLALTQAQSAQCPATPSSTMSAAHRSRRQQTMRRRL